MSPGAAVDNPPHWTVSNPHLPQLSNRYPPPPVTQNEQQQVALDPAHTGPGVRPEAIQPYHGQWRAPLLGPGTVPVPPAVPDFGVHVLVYPLFQVSAVEQEGFVLVDPMG